MTLGGFWLSESRFAARTTASRLRDMGLQEADWNALFARGHRCLLQIEHENEQVGSALVNGELVEAQWDHEVLTVIFNFLENNGETDLLVQELRKTNHQ